MGIGKSCNGCRHNREEPPIFPENAPALQVFLICRRQWRVGFSGAYAIDGNLVWRVLEDLKFEHKTEIFCRVDTLAALYLEEIKK